MTKLKERKLSARQDGSPQGAPFPPGRDLGPGWGRASCGRVAALLVCVERWNQPLCSGWTLPVRVFMARAVFRLEEGVLGKKCSGDPPKKYKIRKQKERKGAQKVGLRKLGKHTQRARGRDPWWWLLSWWL